MEGARYEGNTTGSHVSDAVERRDSLGTASIEADAPEIVIDLRDPDGRDECDTRPGLSRIWVVLAVLAVMPITALFVQRLIDLPEHGWFDNDDNYVVGNDLGVFYTAGILVAEGRPEQLYDADAFRAEYTLSTGIEAQPGTLFGNPPALAVLFAPLADLSHESAWMIWTVISLGALVSALALLGFRGRHLFVAGLVALTLPGYSALMQGQSSMVWVLVLAGVFIALSRRWVFAAGLISGLLLLKPPLLVGLLVWWIVDRRMRRALLGVSVAGLAIVGSSIPLLGGAWMRYPGAVIAFGSTHSSTAGESAQFSPLGFAGLLAPGHELLVLVFAAVAVVIGVAIFIWVYRTHRSHWQFLFAASIFLTLWVSPHVLAHDWVLLVIPLGIVYAKHPVPVIKTSIALAAVALWSVVLTNLMRDSFDAAIQLAVPAYAIAIFLVLRSSRFEVGPGITDPTSSRFSMAP